MAKRYDIQGGAIQPLITLHHHPPPPQLQKRYHYLKRWWIGRNKIFPRSKAAVMILIWNVIVGMTYAAVIVGGMGVPLTAITTAPFYIIVYTFISVYAAVAVLQILFYPLGGLLADVFYGRKKIVFCSFFHIGIGYLFLSILCVILMAFRHMLDKSQTHIIISCFGAIVALLLITGFTGFQANAVQFGLDQLLEASSEELSVFLHWYVWTDNIGMLISHLIGVSMVCNLPLRNNAKYYPIFIVVLLMVLVFVSCYKYKWFRSEPHTRNPYGTIYRVLKFAAKHDRPLRRSAMTYCDDEMPTRLDFPKERFGGPFTTEVVEDVKTFLRILVMLLAIGPIFYLHVAIIYVFPIFGTHIGKDEPVSAQYKCHSSWILFQSGNLSYVISVVTLPIYIILVHPYVSRWFPRILSRLKAGMILMVLSVISLLIIEGVGHSYAAHRNITNIQCMLISEYRDLVGFNFSQTLEIHPIVLAIPNMFTGLAAPLIYITVLEFISAQSPHTMKGLLLGVFYAVRGFFILVGCLSMLPFMQEKLWKGYNNIINCGFHYYLVNVIVGFICIMIFWVAVRWYHYRDREDRPYGPSYVEDYYHRYTRRTEVTVTSPDKEEVGPLVDTLTSDYGTTKT